ncbi:hypothetical protein C8J57DRAFT_1730520 [Mycena rebaudengoi]|nr:hypothetical protein C8J57DRAFT_1392316 [Mycena rebaudengoi]KAJ7230826.1 hypothetical protein C8J57DRAFT_1730520 [Mycena rebaudengoi]
MFFTTHKSHRLPPLLAFVLVAVLATPGLAQLQVSCLRGVQFNCTSFYPTFCASVGNISVNAGNTVTACFNNNPGQQCLLTAFNNVKGPSTISTFDCLNTLQVVSAICPMGGTGQLLGAAFEFSIDPNNGACGIPPGD